MCTLLAYISQSYVLYKLWYFLQQTPKTDRQTATNKNEPCWRVFTAGGHATQPRFLSTIHSDLQLSIHDELASWVTQLLLGVSSRSSIPKEDVKSAES